MHKMTVYFIND